MSINSAEAAQNLIAYTVVEDKSSLINLLKRNGVRISSEASDNSVIVATLTASSKSPFFKKELAKLLTKKAKKAADEFKGFVGDSSDFGFTGIDDFSFTGGGDDFFNLAGLMPSSSLTSTLKATTSKPPTTTTASKKATKQAGRVTVDNPQGKTTAGLFLQNLGKSIFSEDTINAALNVGLTSINNKVAGRQNAIQNEAAVITQRQDEVRQSLAQAPAGSKTLTYVFVGVGILALGAIIYFVVKNKKSN